MSATEYYNHGAYPSTGAAGSSSAMRAELEAIETGFGKLPDLSGNGGKPVVVNAGGTALEATSTPDIGTATGTSLTVTGTLQSSGGIIGYASGAGGTVTQATDKSTSVTLNKLCGTITTNNAALAAGAVVRFIVNNSLVTAGDVPMLAIQNSVTANGYRVWVESVQNNLFRIAIENRTAGSLSDAIVINFAILNVVTA